MQAVDLRRRGAIGLGELGRQIVGALALADELHVLLLASLRQLGPCRCEIAIKARGAALLARELLVQVVDPRCRGAIGLGELGRKILGALVFVPEFRTVLRADLGHLDPRRCEVTIKARGAALFARELLVQAVDLRRRGAVRLGELCRQIVGALALVVELRVLLFDGLLVVRLRQLLARGGQIAIEVRGAALLGRQPLLQVGKPRGRVPLRVVERARQRLGPLSFLVELGLTIPDGRFGRVPRLVRLAGRLGLLLAKAREIAVEAGRAGLLDAKTRLQTLHLRGGIAPGRGEFTGERGTGVRATIRTTLGRSAGVLERPARGLERAARVVLQLVSEEGGRASRG